MAWYGFAARNFPASARVQVGLARAHLAAGDSARAREALTRALELDPQSAEARRLLGPPAPSR